MSVNVYDIGDLVQLPAAFVNDANVPTDPTGVTVKLLRPDGSTSAYVYLTNAEVIKDSTGNYHADIPVTLAGIYKYKWLGVGSVATAQGGQFTVRPSPL